MNLPAAESVVEYNNKSNESSDEHSINLYELTMKLKDEHLNRDDNNNDNNTYNNNVIDPQRELNEMKSKLTKQPRKYQQLIFEKAKHTNSIIFLETGKGKTLISILIIIEKYEQYFLQLISSPSSITLPLKRPKVFFLVCDIALLTQQMKAIETNTGLKVGILKGKSSKKTKNDYNEFKDLLNANDIIVAIPDIIYKLLSIGFLNMNEIDLLIFDECHHCDSNHSYNLIMNDFYFYNKINNPSYKLPQILGLTASPLKKKIKESIETTAMKAMVELSENLDSQIVIDPDAIKSFNEIKQDKAISNGKEYIETKSHIYDAKYNELVNILKEYLLFPFLELCFQETLIDNNSNDILKEQYKQFIDMKFTSLNFAEFVKIVPKYADVYNLQDKHILFTIFAKIQRNIFMLLENLNLFSLMQFIMKYKELYSSKISLYNDNIIQNDLEEYIDMTKLSKEQIYQIYLLFISIEKQLTYKFTTEQFDYYSDRLRGLVNKINEIYRSDITNKVIIFVSSRTVSFFLEEILTCTLQIINKDLKCVSVIGTNRHKTEHNSLFEPKITSTQLNTRINDFNTNIANVLIGTSTVEEGLDIQSCNIVIVFSELTTAKSYIQMKGRARKDNAKLLAFTSNKIASLNLINDFIQLNECMQRLFGNEEYVKDFRREGFVSKKKFDEFYYVPQTQAKLTLRNVIPIYNDITQQLNNKGLSVKVNKKCSEAIVNKIKCFKYDIEFKGGVVGYNSKCDVFNISSKLYNDKQSGENECLLRFVEHLHKLNYLDDNFKLNIN